MKRELTGMAMAVLLLGTASCSQNEIDEPNGAVTPPTGKGVTLGVNVGVSTGAQTKSAVTGTAITFKDYGRDDHAIGLVVANEEAAGYYAAETPNFNTGYDNYGTTITELCFVGDAEGKNWKAIDMSASFPGSAGNEKEKTFYLDKNRGQIFAYFPYDKTKAKKVAFEGGKVNYPIDIVATPANPNTKLATVNNSAKIFTAGAWKDNDAASKVNILAEETDYLYFIPADGKGRYVNNGSKPGTDGTVTTPDGTNTDENPGNSINLTMKHALSMVTFRLYDKDLVGKAPASATATNLGSVQSFKIENVGEGGPLKIGATTMNLAVTDGESPIDATAGTYVSGSIERTLDGKYLLIRARQDGTDGEKPSVTTYLFPEKGDGRDAANNISTLVYPITGMESNSVKVTFNILEPSKSTAFPLTASLPVPEDGGWLPNKNYIYTFSVSKKGLNVVDVTVADWESVEVEGVVDL